MLPVASIPGAVASRTSPLLPALTRTELPEALLFSKILLLPPSSLIDPDESSTLPPTPMLLLWPPINEIEPPADGLAPPSMTIDPPDVP
jgi:hypothetical protein